VVSTAFVSVKSDRDQYTAIFARAEEAECVGGRVPPTIHTCRKWLIRRMVGSRFVVVRKKEDNYKQKEDWHVSDRFHPIRTGQPVTSGLNMGELQAEEPLTEDCSTDDGRFLCLSERWRDCLTSFYITGV
jgi:hypothetical protein